MPTSFTPDPARGINFQNVVYLAEARVRAGPERTVFRYREAGAWQGLSGRQWWNRSSSVAAVLRSDYGVVPGATVAVVARNRIEWPIVDLAIAMCGAISVPIDPSLTDADIAFILSDADVALLITDEPSRFEGRPTLDLRRPVTGVDASLDEVRRAIGPADPLSIVYTSGTSGQPKGVVITHGNLVFESWALCNVFPVETEDTQLLILPLSHIFGRHMLWGAVEQGSITCVAPSRGSLAQHMVDVAPTYIGVPPRVLERVRSRIEREILGRGPVTARSFRRALEVGEQVVQRREDGRGLGRVLAAQWQLAQRLFFRHIQARLGGQLRFVITGGAPIDAAVVRFFEACGVSVVAGYGLTETTGAITVQRVETKQPGTVGQALPHCEIRIAEDGEVCVRGPNVTPGYHRDPGLGTFDDQGWFHTGDLGEMRRGALIIKDRKNDLFKTTGGHYVSPGRLETRLEADPAIAHAVVFGGGRPFPIALLSLDLAPLRELNRAEGWGCHEDHEIRVHPRVVQLVRNHVEEVNRGLSRFEQIRRHAIVPEFGGDELTMTLKVRRRAVLAIHAALVDSLYREEAPSIAELGRD